MELSTGSRQGCSDALAQPSRVGMADSRVLITLGRKPAILPKIQARGREREGEREEEDTRTKGERP